MAANISGTVKDAVSGGAAKGATITIKQLRKSANADKKGRFSFTQLPTGDYTLVVKYKDSEYYLEGFYSQTDEDRLNTQTEWNFSEDHEKVTCNPLGPDKPGDFFSAEGENEKEADFFYQEQETYWATLGTRQFWGQWTVEADAHYSRAETDLDTAEWSFDGTDVQSYVEVDGKFPWG
jgi:hypothetical protein